VQTVCIWSSWCHCLQPKTSSSLASFQSRLVLPFWYRLTQVVLEKRPLSESSSSSYFYFMDVSFSRKRQKDDKETKRQAGRQTETDRQTVTGSPLTEQLFVCDAFLRDRCCHGWDMTREDVGLTHHDWRRWRMEWGKRRWVTLPIAFVHLQYNKLHPAMLLTPIVVLCNKHIAITSVWRLLYRTICISRQPPSKHWRVLLQQSYTAQMPLLRATSTFGWG